MSLDSLKKLNKWLVKHEILDNFLPDSDYERVHKTLMDDIHWKFNDGVNLPGDGYHQFTHLFYAQFEPRSPHFSDIFPIINEIEPIALVRIKANLNMKTPEIVQHEFHTDVDDCITAIYYVNTNNGKTIFESGVEVDSVANRMLIFNSNERHAGTTCTDTLRRCVINFNYFI